MSKYRTTFRPIDSAMPWLPEHVKQMQRAMDRSDNVPEAIRSALLSVFMIGYRSGYEDAVNNGDASGRANAIAAE